MDAEGRDLPQVTPVYLWRGAFGDAELNALHADAFGHPVLNGGWTTRVERFSLGWVTARIDDALAGFVNVAWDGGAHGFIIDTAVSSRSRRHGIGHGLLATAEVHSRLAGLEWLHVDFQVDLASFYLGGGFRPTQAGLIRLQGDDARA
jgi:ribosomal protein S18 acetylase RimI-like enzyme